MSAMVLGQALSVTRDVLSRVSADQLDQPTPCASWRVRELVNHIVGGALMFTVAAETGTAPEDGDADVTAGDMNASFDHVAKRAIAAFGAPGAMERMITMPIGQLPGSAVVWIAAMDSFVHGWDLAKATGQNTDLDAGLAEQLLETARATLPDEMRGPDGEAAFGAEVEVADSAPAADRLAGFFGRTP